MCLYSHRQVYPLPISSFLTSIDLLAASVTLIIPCLFLTWISGMRMGHGRSILYAPLREARLFPQRLRIHTLRSMVEMSRQHHIFSRLYLPAATHHLGRHSPRAMGQIIPYNRGTLQVSSECSPSNNFLSQT